MTDKVRFTAWLSEAENDRLRAAARERNTSANFIVRTVLRAALGLDRAPEPAEPAEAAK